MRVEWRQALAFGIGAAAMAGVAFAQAGAAFEVTLVRGATRGALYTRTPSRTPERIAFHATQVGDIIAFAYGFPADRVDRRPQWMYDDFYDVAVTTAAPASLEEQKLLLQKLLEERFGLVVHRISRGGPVYFLVAGAKVNLTETKVSDLGEVPQFRTTGRPDPFPVYAARHVSMSDLAAWLYSQVKLPVFDKTGITGFFDIEITGLPLRDGAEGTIRAVHNSLGLDLEAHSGPMETLIIDDARRPSAQ